MTPEQIKSALADAIEAAIDSVHDMDVTHTDYARAAAAAIYELVKPKPLVWAVEIYTATIGHRAECYIITQSKNGGVCFLSSGHPHNIGALKYPTIEAAQAAAQSDADAAHWANTSLGDLIGGK